MTDTSLYETDIVAWADRQVAELRRLAATASSNAVDWANVIEEIESVGRSEWKGVQSQLRNTFSHLIKGYCDPRSLSHRAWGVEVHAFLMDVRADYRPSMRSMLDLDQIWRNGFRLAYDELRYYRIAIRAGVPEICPFSIEQVLDEAFTYESALSELTRLGPEQESKDD